MVEEEHRAIVEYQISWRGRVVAYGLKFVQLSVAIFISYFILYKESLHCADCSPVVTIFFALLVFCLLEAVGLPVSKIIEGVNLRT